MNRHNKQHNNCFIYLLESNNTAPYRELFYNLYLVFLSVNVTPAAAINDCQKKKFYVHIEISTFPILF